jgi:hypothetical protein
MKHGVATVDFNKVLMTLNVLVAGLLSVTYFREQSNDYINQHTLLLGLVLSVETHIALLLERKRRDPFVIMLAFSTILYYSLRLYTLALFEFSIVFDRFAYDAGDSNFALLFIIIANLFLYAGLFLARSRTTLEVNAAGRRPNFPLGVVLLMLATFAITYLGGRWGEDAPRPVAVLVVFLSPPIIVAMALAYYFLFKGSLSRRFAIATGALILLEIVAHTLLGSRSALVGLVQSCIMVALAIWGHIKLRRSAVITGIALLPVGAVLLVAAFTISTYNRAAQDSGGYSLDVSRAFALAGEAGSDLSSAGPALDVLISPVAARAGFFDFSAEIIAHRDKYRAVINVPAYFKSVVDNILTPGFDVFDQPKIANSLLFVYRDWGLPSKEQVARSDVYQSDQLGVYGEFYALFGYACLPLLFLMTYFLKTLYMRVASADPFVFAMKRIIVLSIFARSIDSFGVDWTIGEVLPLVVATFLYAPLFSSKPRTAGQIDSPQLVRASDP